MSSESQDYIRSKLHAGANFNSLARHASILFADLVGSTEFKRHHTPLEGLAKTALHNAVATDTIASFDGKVSKYLGDGVLGVFEGDRSAAQAVRAAVAIILAIETANSQQDWNNFPKAMSTRIGIHTGSVWMFEFPQATTEDPQGTVVDVASRLTGLAGAQQIVVTDEAFQAAAQEASVEYKETLVEINELGANIGPVSERLIKGVREPIKLRSVAPFQRAPSEILLSGHSRTPEPQIVERLKQARDHLRSGELQESLPIFEAVVNEDPGNFEANVRAAQILLQTNPNNRKDEEKILDEVIRHLSLAKQIRPESCRVWHLASWTRYRRFELLRNLVDLKNSVQFAEIALSRAEEMMDIDGALLAKICLAWKLLVRSEWVPETSAADLSRAGELCRDVSNDVRNVQGILLADYLYTHALVRLAQGDQDHEGIEKMIEEAEQANKSNEKLSIASDQLRRARLPRQPVMIP